MMNSTATNTAKLRAAARQPPIPFRIALADGQEVSISRLLRVLPGKRIVGAGHFNGQPVLVKLFISSSSERHWQREQQGITALIHAGLPTPEIIIAGALAESGHALISRFLEPAESLADIWQRARSPEAASAALRPALATVAAMHSVGLLQEDLHLGNFLLYRDILHVIDGDAVRMHTPGTPLDSRTAGRNFAILLAQLPAQWDEKQAELLAYYHQHTSIRLNPDALRQAVQQTRQHRLDDFLRKSVRDCSLFSVQHHFRRFTSVPREQAEALATVLADPEQALAQGTLLKDGGSATVVRIPHPEFGTLVIKRYNLKNRRHALSRAWRPSRAWHSWREGFRLQFLGIATPQPLALIEERIGPLRQRAWLVTTHCAGQNLLQHLDPSCPPPPAEATALLALVNALRRERISHGDFKATNLLWENGQVVLIDLDAMRQHHSEQSYAPAWRRDRHRLLRNWPEDSPLHQWLDTQLPAG